MRARLQHQIDRGLRLHLLPLEKRGLGHDQGEWVDLDIDLGKPHHEEGWTWNSGFEPIARIDAEKHVWYAAMRIPFSAIDARPPVAGNTLRINLFVSQGPQKNHQEVAWRAPLKETFHVPERFGLIRLVAK